MILEKLRKEKEFRRCFSLVSLYSLSLCHSHTVSMVVVIAVLCSLGHQRSSGRDSLN